MTKLNPQNISIGFIFPYNLPVDEGNLANWLTQRDFQLVDSENQASVFQGGVRIEGGPFAVNNQIQVLYEPEADISGFSDSSFITFKTTEDVSYDEIHSYAEDFFNTYEGADFDTLGTVELTYNGIIRVDSGSHDFSNYFNNNKLETLTELGPSDINGAAAVIEPNINNSENGWFRMVLDTESISNPHIWNLQFQYRVDSLEDLDIDKIETTLKEFIDSSGTSD